MDIEELRAYCLSLPMATEDVKWGKDLCFCIDGKMFCVTMLEESFGASFKVPRDEFEDLCSRPGIGPSPYLGRFGWVWVAHGGAMPEAEWKERLHTSYRLVAAGLPAKFRKNLTQ